ncbi:uncharacterized protein LOC128235150 [Mya arenaria]|uniref:uncharacterized protein LOC128235150 n=1 Tax=Mya arenaria TaxID=6604 RepID=UPI0022E13879|nr:uncharacterized protein LOC128235150 [Mya arenaria]XP_052805852.1 uncharacterized protein LOC128235150 [Mya arenaria]
MNMERKLVLTKEAFPRYAYTSKNAEQLDKKGTCLRSTYHSATDPPLDFGEISIAIKSFHLNSLSADELRYKKTLKKEGRSETAHNGDETTEEKRKGCINPQITITTYDDVQHGSISPFKDITGDILIIVEDNPKETDKALNPVRRNLDKSLIVKSCSREQIAKTICTSLEIFVLRVLKSRITALKNLYDQLKPIEDVDTPSTTRSGKKFREIEYFSDRQQIEMIKDTLHEAHALYRRSGISQDESSFGEADVPILSDKLAKSLYIIDDRIYGCGFRNSTLEIFVNVSQGIMSDKAYQQLCLKIGATAKEYDVFETEIKVGRYEQVNYSSCQVGTRIKSDMGQFATLGGFARKEGTLHVLLARHFADPEQVRSIYYIDGEEGSTFLARVLSGSHRGIYDISVGKVSPNISNTMFRNSDGHPMNSSLMDMSTVNRRDLCERHVHFWADEQQPRVGKIVIPDFDERSSNTRYVLIKELLEFSEEHNELRPRRLCKMGHSGAIFCSDDIDGQCVHVCTMLMGSLNSRDMANNPNVQGEYTSFPLNQGITQLNEEHGGDFNIC